MNTEKTDKIKKTGMTAKRSEIINTANIAAVAFYIGLSLELFYVLWDKSAWQIGSDGILFRISFVFLLIKVMLTRYTKREKAAVIIFTIIGLISYVCSSRNDVLRVIILIASCKDIDIDKMLKYVFGVMTAGCTAIVLMSLLGIAGDISRTEEYRKDVMQTRYVLGMGHPNALHCMFWALVTLGTYVYWKKMRWYHYLMLAVADLGLYKLTDSNIGFIMTLLAIVIAAFLGIRSSRVKGRIVGIAGIAGTLAEAAISLATAYYGMIYNENGLWNEPHFEQIKVYDSKFFHGRLWSAYGYPDSQMGVFGLFSSPQCTRQMDMGYYKLFYTYGYIPAVIYIILLIMLIVYGMKKERYDIIMLVTAWSAYNLLEAHEISEYIGRNYMYLLMGAYWMQMLHADKGKSDHWLGMGRTKGNEISDVSAK